MLGAAPEECEVSDVQHELVIAFQGDPEFVED